MQYASVHTDAYWARDQGSHDACASSYLHVLTLTRCLRILLSACIPYTSQPEHGVCYSRAEVGRASYVALSPTLTPTPTPTFSHPNLQVNGGRMCCSSTVRGASGPRWSR